jgi:hypothetical protein
VSYEEYPPEARSDDNNGEDADDEPGVAVRLRGDDFGEVLGAFAGAGVEVCGARIGPSRRVSACKCGHHQGSGDDAEDEDGASATVNSANASPSMSLVRGWSLRKRAVTHRPAL